MPSIPYQGRLEIGGVPFNGTAALTFHLYDDASAAEIWASPQPVDVAVQGGAFAVLIGQGGSIPLSLFNAAELFFSIDVDGNALSGRQRIATVPMAIRAGRAYALDVDTALTTGSLDVQTTVDVGGDLNLSKDVDGTARINFPVAVGGNDPGQITRVEPSPDVGEIWLASSDNWDDGQGSDSIVFGDVGSGTVRQQFRGDGSAVMTGNLRVDSLTVEQTDLDYGGAQIRNLRLTAAGSPNGTSGSATCGVGNGACLACFVDNDAHAPRACNDASSNRNCLCVRPE